ncbi:MAG: NUDIX domain-containing protein [Chlamydiae bacterium]|nr:NUDIX domain-containing protein [Chlamydiota bacterium]
MGVLAPNFHLKELKMNKVFRLGAYALVIKEEFLLLTKKQKGLYKGLWDLPGGGIEFYETPEEALKRELLEEVAYDIKDYKLFLALGTTNPFTKEDQSYLFHHVGVIYLVTDWEEKKECIPEEKMEWFSLKTILNLPLTPLAKEALKAPYFQSLIETP